jgi:hypothetical protein
VLGALEQADTAKTDAERAAARAAEAKAAAARALVRDAHLSSTTTVTTGERR